MLHINGINTVSVILPIITNPIRMQNKAVKLKVHVKVDLLLTLTNTL